MGAALNVAKPTRGSTVAIFGLGTVGLAVSKHFYVSLICGVLLILQGAWKDQANRMY